jgi:hypothetical protein
MNITYLTIQDIPIYCKIVVDNLDLVKKNEAKSKKETQNKRKSTIYNGKHFLYSI